jgi:DNA invertase Pin-like site-specific DNA recombinase
MPTHSRGITPEKTQQIKELLKRKLSQRQIANRAGVSQYTVWNIVHGRYDKHDPLILPTKTLFTQCPITGV